MSNNTQSDHNAKELEQEKELLKKINKLLTSDSEKSKEEKKRLQNEIEGLKHKSKELEMQKKFLDKSVRTSEERLQKLSKKHIMTIVGAVCAIGLIITGYSFYVVDLVGQEYGVDNLGTVKSNYVIQNLRGDTVDTWLSWRLVDGATLHVNVVDAGQYPDKLDLINEVILSSESIEIDDSLLHKGPKGSTSVYYLGWAGALSDASEDPTELYIPTDLQIIESASGEGQITIHLTDAASGDGFSGYTKSIADDSQNQILKSDITIYKVDKLNDEQFKTILRHEFGHALGLAHSTAPEDLMAPEVTTKYPYISQCDVSAIAALYDGSEQSQVVCEK